MKEGQYEARYLLLMLKYIMKDEDVPAVLRPVNWIALFRLANFQDVAHLVYYAVVFRNVEMSEEWMERYRLKYQEAVIYEERTRKVQEVLQWQLEKHKIHHVFLNSDVICKYYERSEMCGRKSVEILVEKGRSRAIAEFMRAMDYEPLESPRPGVTVYHRIPDMTVYFYDRLEFNIKKMSQYFSYYLSRLRITRNTRYTHEFQKDSFYIYYMSMLSYHYAKGTITLQMVLNLWIFFQHNEEEIDWQMIQKELSKMGIWEFSQRLRILTHIWFTDGYRLDQEMDIHVYEAMEEYILTRGERGRRESSHLLPLFTELADIEVKSERKERLKKAIKWMFPERAYMQKLYPSIEKHRLLMYPCWVHRMIRTFVRYIAVSVKSLAVRIRDTISGLGSVMRMKAVSIWDRFMDKFRKNDEAQEEAKEEEAPEETVGETGDEDAEQAEEESI